MAKLRPGMREKPNGSIEYRFQYNGKRYSVTAKSVKEVLQKEQDLRQDIATGMYSKNKYVTLDQYFDEWIRKREMWQKHGSILRYKSTYSIHVSMHLGRYKLVDIERRMILGMQEEERKLNPKCANLAVQLVCNILNDAVRDEIIMRNPALMIPKIPTESDAAETKHRALTRKEQAAFVDALEGVWYRELFMLMLLTGVRIGEACALRWTDVDYEKDVIHITRTVAQSTSKANIVENSPKSKAGVRDIPLNEDIRRILVDQKKKISRMPYMRMDDRIFLSTRLAPAIPYDIVNPLHKIILKMRRTGIEIENFTSHALRDTFATRYIESGGSMQVLKKILGHSSITMTMDLYAHVLDDTKAEEMKRIKII